MALGLINSRKNWFMKGFAVLVIENLVKVYPGGVTALQGIGLEIERGMFGLLGPNGAGKSTLMKILAGLLEPTSGKIQLNGEDILSDPQLVWRQLGYLPQDFGFYPHLSGEAMLTYMLKLKGVESPRGLKHLVAELLERVNLSFAASRKVKEYSGGMRQRLGIAQAIAGDPGLIIVDEPTTGLDPEERLRFYHLLSELSQDRIVLLSTHIVEDVSMLCPRFAIIRQGQVVKRTTPSQALGELEGHLFEGVVDRNDMDRIYQSWLVTQVVLFEGKNHARVFSPEGAPPEGFTPVKPTLEDAYFSITRKVGEVHGGVSS